MIEDVTTISVDRSTRERLEELKIIPAESFDDVLNRIVDEYEEQNDE